MNNADDKIIHAFTADHVARITGLMHGDAARPRPRNKSQR
jgi:hypothetical protein